MIQTLLYIFAGIIQGLLEWIPVSSKSNLVIFFMHFSSMNLTTIFSITIMLHIGTVLAAIVYFREEISTFLKSEVIYGVFSKNLKYHNYKEESNYLKFILISVFFTFLIMGPIYLFARNSLDNLDASIVLLGIGILLFIIGLVQYLSRKSKERQVNYSTKNATVLGLFQGLTIIPGISRSGATTSVLLFQGYSPADAFKISFLLSIPTVLIGEIGFAILNGIVFNKFILLGIVVSFIVGYIMIDVVLKIAKKVNFSYFCMGLGIVYVLIYVSSLIFNFVL